jgi:Protein of unknown function (DUF2846)
MRSAYRVALSTGMLLACCLLTSTMAAAQSQAAPRETRSARLYFIRESSGYGMGARPGIKINGQAVGSLDRGSYFFIDRPPGRYTLRIEPPVPLGYFETDVTVAAGRTYYYEAGPEHSSTAGVLLPILAGNVGKPMTGRSFNSGWQFNSLDAATGAAEVKKLAPMKP